VIDVRGPAADDQCGDGDVAEHVVVDTVMASGSAPLENLDALTWLNLSVLDRFRQEFAIQQSWLRAKPPAASDLGKPQQQRAAQIGMLVAEGLRSGEMRAGRMGGAAPPLPVLSACVRDLIWLPVPIVDAQGKRAALEHSRATLFRGAAAGGPGER
jgi:hypothetical protein